MVRVLLLTYGSRGDLEPMAALAVRLRDLGVEARVCAPPDEEFADLLAADGITMVPFGQSLRAWVGGDRPPTADDAFERAAGWVADHFGPVAEAAEGCSALVATGLVPAGARSVAEKLGIPYAYACFQPVTLPSPHHPASQRPPKPFPPDVTDNRELWRLDAENVDALFRAPLNRHRAAVGLPPVDAVRDHVFTDRPWLAADPLLAPWREPADVDVVQTGAWIRPDDRPLPPELEAFLAAGPPPVYVGFGSMPMHGARDVARTAVAAARAVGRRAIIARGWAGLTPDDAADCLAIGEVNQQKLFGRVAAVVHHGGAGTTTAAARAGAPQVVVPQVVDQPYWGGRVAELGIGALHDAPDLTPASLASALATALAAQGRASEVAPAIRTDGAAVAAKLLLDAITSETK
ncbi:Zeaxanthin glucosyltransferase [Actinomadura rubteroloni]|uniref:Zeaxanthin glucosyltransferase n=1 Tax=Actinomadura rubteroloni TaxID=1926885 RepID=A0A2P4UKJ3_9ACTN|nr:glycosyltransferase [Actinomadura rubteroloni]POM25572.1 Zeaxanthin glucosyltransferase [Actinomadura rubteroloni]